MERPYEVTGWDANTAKVIEGVVFAVSPAQARQLAEEQGLRFIVVKRRAEAMPTAGEHRQTAASDVGVLTQDRAARPSADSGAARQANS